MSFYVLFSLRHDYSKQYPRGVLGTEQQLEFVDDVNEEGKNQWKIALDFLFSCLQIDFLAQKTGPKISVITVENLSSVASGSTRNSQQLEGAKKVAIIKFGKRSEIFNWFVCCSFHSLTLRDRERETAYKSWLRLFISFLWYSKFQLNVKSRSMCVCAWKENNFVFGWKSKRNGSAIVLLLLQRI